MMNRVESTGLLGVIIVVIIAVIAVVLLVSFIGGNGKYRYVIDTPDSRYFADTYVEKDGCVEFMAWGNLNIKQCGTYTIHDWGNN
jgi:hypothetical protein